MVSMLSFNISLTTASTPQGLPISNPFSSYTCLDLRYLADVAVVKLMLNASMLTILYPCRLNTGWQGVCVLECSLRLVPSSSKPDAPTSPIYQLSGFFSCFLPTKSFFFFALH